MVRESLCALTPLDIQVGRVLQLKRVSQEARRIVVVVAFHFGDSIFYRQIQK